MKMNLRIDRLNKFFSSLKEHLNAHQQRKYIKIEWVEERFRKR